MLCDHPEAEGEVCVIGMHFRVKNRRDERIPFCVLFTEYSISEWFFLIIVMFSLL